MYEVLFHDERPIVAAAVVSLNATIGWWPDRTEKDIASVLGPFAIGSWDGDELVGFARVVSDGTLRAYIEDVMVNPVHQHLGIASSMLDRLLARVHGVRVVSLFCTEPLVSLYASAGFERTHQVVLHRRCP